MRIVVTGGTGFLGGALTRRLLADGHQVIALGRDRAKLAKLATEGAETLAADLSSPFEIPVPACDTMVHCAALSSPWGQRADFVRANVTGTRTALKLARHSGVQRFVHISTPSLYFRFRDQICMREDAPLPPPVNGYAETKRAAEELALAAPDLDPIVLRPRGLYGPGDTTLLPRLLAAARARALPLIRHGRAATDLTYVGDVVEAICAALIVRAPSQRIFNISGGDPLNVHDVAEQAAKRAGIALRWRKAPLALVLAYARASEFLCSLHPRRVEPPITAYGVGLFAFTQTLDISAAHAQLGWAPRVRFAEGLELAFAGAPA